MNEQFSMTDFRQNLLRAFKSLFNGMSICWSPNNTSATSEKRLLIVFLKTRMRSLQSICFDMLFRFIMQEWYVLCIDSSSPINNTPP